MTAVSQASHTRTAPSGMLPALLAAALCALACGAFDYLVISTGEDARQYLDAQGLALFSFTRAAVCMAFGAYVALSLTRDLVVRLRPIGLVLAYFAMTALWSQSPGDSLTGLYRLLCAALPGVWIALAQDPAARLARLGQAALFLVLLNLVAIVLFPELVFMRGLHDGALRGAFVHKNLMGICLTFVALIACARAIDTRRLSWLLLAGVAFCGVVLSQSSTALAILVMALVLIGGLACLARLMARWALAFLVVSTLATALLLIPFAPDLVASLSDILGRDGSLTGRTGIWDFGVRRAGDGGLVGYGYQAFWPSITLAGTHGFGQTWLPVHAHNGFLDAWLSGGAAGLVLVLALFALLWWRAIAALAADAPLGQRLFPLAAVFALTLYNWVETLFPSGATLVPALIVALLGLGHRRTQTEVRI